MIDWSSAPTFGQPDLTLPRQIRPSAYALILDGRGQLALVRTPRGYYLPGGGAFAAESVIATVEREAREEIGLHVTAGTWRRVAIEHAPAPNEGASFEKHSSFCDAVVVGPTGFAAETGHVAVWVTPADAIALLLPESHRWAVAEWLADQTAE